MGPSGAGNPAGRDLTPIVRGGVVGAGTSGPGRNTPAAVRAAADTIPALPAIPAAAAPPIAIPAICDP